MAANSTPAERKKKVAKFRKSGLSQKAFAEKENISPVTLGRWIKEVDGDASKTESTAAETPSETDEIVSETNDTEDTETDERESGSTSNEDRRKFVAEYLWSGDKLEEFVAEHNLVANTFRGWVKNFKNEITLDGANLLQTSNQRRLLEKFKDSGLTKKTFCQQEGINQTAFDVWQQWYADDADLSVSVEIDVPQESDEEKASVASESRKKTAVASNDTNILNFLNVFNPHIKSDADIKVALDSLRVYYNLGELPASKQDVQARIIDFLLTSGGKDGDKKALVEKLNTLISGGKGVTAKYVYETFCDNIKAYQTDTKFLGTVISAINSSIS